MLGIYQPPVTRPHLLSHHGKPIDLTLVKVELRVVLPRHAHLHMPMVGMVDAIARAKPATDVNRIFADLPCFSLDESNSVVRTRDPVGEGIVLPPPSAHPPTAQFEIQTCSICSSRPRQPIAIDGADYDELN